MHLSIIDIRKVIKMIMYYLLHIFNIFSNKSRHLENYYSVITSIIECV